MAASGSSSLRATASRERHNHIPPSSHSSSRNLNNGPIHNHSVRTCKERPSSASSSTSSSSSSFRRSVTPNHRIHPSNNYEGPTFSLSLSLCVFLSGHKLISRTVSAQGLFYEYMNFLGGFTKFSKFSGFNDIYSNFLLATQFCCVRRFSFDFWYLGLLQNVFFFNFYFYDTLCFW